MKRIALYIGLTLTLIGMISTILVSIYGLTIKENLQASEMARDYDPDTKRFKSYYNNEIITISGMITKEKKNEYSRNVNYILDGKLKIFSEKDIGGVDDRVIVKVEVIEVCPATRSKGYHTFHELRVISFQKVETPTKSDIMFYKIIGIIVFIIGNVICWINCIEVKKKLPINEINE